jgi:hypothetical protein
MLEKNLVEMSRLMAEMAKEIRTNRDEINELIKEVQLLKNKQNDNK